MKKKWRGQSLGMIRKIICFLAVFVFCLNFVSAADGFFHNSWDFIKVNSIDTWEKGKIIFDLVADKSAQPLGFEAGLSFWKYFIIGFLAGVILWLFYIFIIRAYWAIKDVTDRMNPYKEIKGRWIELVAGRVWRVFVLGFFYAVIMQIPILNRLIQIISLDMFIEGTWSIFFKPVILAIEIGFIPTIFEHYYLKVKPRVEYEKAMYRRAKERALVSDS